MKIFTAILLTLAWMAVPQLIGLWIHLIPVESEYYFSIIPASGLINRVMSLALLILLLWAFKQYDSLKFNKANPVYYMAAIVLGIAFLFFQSVLAILYYLEFSSDYFHWDFSLELFTKYPFIVIGGVLIAPIAEELFFRNFLLRGLLKNYSVPLAILLSSLLFASVHIPMDKILFGYGEISFRQTFMTLFGGAIAGLLFYKSKSIIPPILYHMFWNLTAAIF